LSAQRSEPRRCWYTVEALEEIELDSTAPIASYHGATLLADEQLVDRAADLARSSQAESTRRGYASDLRCFEAFCRARGLERMPATPQTVALYVTHLAPTHRVATIRRRLAAIAVEHRRAGLDSPASHRIVREIMRGTARRYGSAVRRVDAATVDLVGKMLLAVRGDDLAAKRDRALLLLGFACALRRSELAALDVEDLHFSKRGLLVTIRRSKTDQEGRGVEIAVPHRATESLCAVRATRLWLAGASVTSGAAFRTLTPHRHVTDRRIAGADVARLIKTLAARAGIKGDFAGHSLRAGFVTSAAEAHVSLENIMRTSRHRSLSVLQGYVRRADAFDAPALAAIVA